MSTLYTHNNKLVKINNKFVEKYVAPPHPDEVTIGTQTWKTAYLDIDDGQGGVKNCYASDPTLKFYNYNAATRICTANYPGWHVAVETDYNVLLSNALNNADTSTFNDLFGTEYGGTDKYGLNLRPMTMYLYNGNSYIGDLGKDYINLDSAQANASVYISKSKNAAECYGLCYSNSAFVMRAFSKSAFLKYGSVTDVYTIIRIVKDS